MYYSNINDDEVKMFHGVTAPNFTIKLTDILHKTGGSFDNKLFKIEEIVSGKVFKIYPMFNTVKITSSNSNDKIMDNRLIIAEKTSKETRISFISDEDEDIEDYVSYGSYKSIGDNLTTAEFNAIVQLLRNNHHLTENLHIKNGTLNGEYGDYTFDIDSTTIVDNGILVTNETLTNLGTVTLTEPSFNNATYTLYLTVYSYDDVNIMTDETTTDPTITTLEIELIKDTPVNIPFNTLTSSCIVSFEATIIIKQDKPVIRGAIVTGLNLSSNKTTIQTGETTTLTMLATDLTSLGVPAKQVQLYKNSTLLKTLTTNNQGICTYNYNSTGAGEIEFNATSGLISSTTLTIGDYLIYDAGVTGDKSNKWNIGGAVTQTVTANGTILSVVNATVTSGYNTGTIGLNGDFEITVYIENEGTGNRSKARFGVTDASNRTFIQGTTGYYKLKRASGTYTGYTSDDGETWTETTLQIDTASRNNTVYPLIGVYAGETTGTLTFKDLKAYKP